MQPIFFVKIKKNGNEAGPVFPFFYRGVPAGGLEELSAGRAPRFRRAAQGGSSQATQ
jgi:hypothetical protein